VLLTSQRRHQTQVSAASSTGNGLSFMVGRVSYSLGLVGPCIGLDTACSSSLVGVRQIPQTEATNLHVCPASSTNMLAGPQSNHYRHTYWHQHGSSSQRVLVAGHDAPGAPCAAGRRGERGRDGRRQRHVLSADHGRHLPAPGALLRVLFRPLLTGQDPCRLIGRCRPVCICCADTAPQAHCFGTCSMLGKHVIRSRAETATNACRSRCPLWDAARRSM